MSEKMTKTIFACICGAPNVGKSSLLNAILGEKIAIVSPKPQTTRTSVLGIWTEGDLQAVFTDTPGLLLPKNALGEHMVRQVEAGTSGTDCMILVVEAGKKPKPAELELIEGLKKHPRPAILVINKVDLLKDKTLLIPQIEKFTELHQFDAVVPVSAKKGDGIAIIMQELSKFAEESPFMYDPDDITDQPQTVLCAEYIREQILYHMHDEIPHGVAVMTETFERTEDGIELGAVIFCERENHKGMLIGKQGSMLKKIRLGAQKALSEFFGEKVHITLWVRVKEDWRSSEYLIRDFGLDFKQ